MRPIDEEYWNRYRATPKAFIPIERGQQLWSSRHGGLTALRLVPPEGTPLAAAREQYEKALLGELDPLALGFSVYDVRAQRLAASSGATDFGEYFTYFSTFLVVSALLLAGLFFKLGVEQRLQEIGLLQALGLDPAAIRRLFVGEALFLAGIGGVVGMAGAIAYSALIMLGLRTWWVDAVGTTALTLHVDPISLVAGALAVVAIAVASIWWSLRSLATASTRSLLAGTKRGRDPIFRQSLAKTAPDPLFAGIAAGVLAVALLVGTALGVVPRVAGFFGAGALSLVAMLCLASRLAAPRPLGRASRPRHVGRLAAGVAQHRVPAGAERALYRAHCLCDVRHRRGRSVQARRTGRAARSPFRRRRISAAGRDAAADRARPQRRGGARRDESAGGRRPARRSLRSVSRAPGRRHELPESLSAEEPAHHRRQRRTSSTAGDSRSTARWPRRPKNARIRGCCSIASSRTGSFRSSPTPTR